MCAAIHVISAYHPTDKPWGGANNFLRALLPELARRHGIIIRYLKDEPENNPPAAEIIFFNQLGAGPGMGSASYSAHDIENIRCRYPGAKVLVRAINLRRHARYNAWLPYWLARADQRKDRAVKKLVEMADFVIFQSGYQRGIFKNYGYQARESVVIHNGAPVMFAQKGRQSARKLLDPSKPVKILTTSVSGNPRKRLELIARLSGLPDVEITHAGFWHENIPPGRVRVLGTVDHDSVCELMKDSDYYMMLSEGDMCPNALIEALAFGLPLIYNAEGGGGAEIGMAYGVAFDESDMAGTVKKARKGHAEFVEKIAAHRDDFLITRAADAYAEVLKKLAGRP